MKLIQFGSYIFPYNPTSLTITMEQKQAVHTLPLQGTVSQLIGRELTRVEGEGEAAGAKGEELLAKLAVCLRNQEKALLILPDCQPFEACLTRLELLGKGGRERYGFRFVFMEHSSIGGGKGENTILPYSVM